MNTATYALTTVDGDFAITIADTAAAVGDTEASKAGRDMYLVLPPLVLLVLITCVANLTVMVCTRMDSKLRSAHSNLYVFSLAFADFLVGLLVMPAMSVYTVFDMWPLGDALCTMWIVLDFVCCTVSMLHLCLIAHDRYMAMAKPLKYKVPGRRGYTVRAAGCAWLVGILIWLIPVLYFRIGMEPVPLDCYFFPNRIFLSIQAVVVYFLPILVMTYFYIVCVYTLRGRYAKIANFKNARSTANSNKNGHSIATNIAVTRSSITTDVSTIAAALNGSAAGPSSACNTTDQNALNVRAVNRRHQKHIRGIRTLGVVILIFLFCWMPFCLFWPIAAYCETCISAEWYEYSYWAAYINSTVNPLLYYLCMKDFRRALRLLIIKLWPWCKQRDLK